MAYDPNVRNPEIEEKMRGIAEVIGGVLPKEWGFTIFIERRDGIQETFYISCFEREGMVKALHEFIEKQTLEDDGCGVCGCPSAHWEKNPDGNGYKTEPLGTPSKA